MLTRIRNTCAIALASLAAALHTEGGLAIAARLVQPTGGGGPRPVEPK